LRVVSWNCRRASAEHSLWTYFEELTPDIAVLQEVQSIPARVLEAYDVRLARPITRKGNPQRFQSVLLVRGQILEPVKLDAELDWVNRELERFAAGLMAFRVQVRDGPALTVIGVYSPAWPVDRERLQGMDVSSVKLKQNPEVWVTDLLVAALRHRARGGSTPMVVAGDFNLSETFDRWKGGPRGNREWLDRMAALGFTECLRQHQGTLTPTYRRPGKVEPESQIDHLFVTQELAAKLVSCRTGDAQRVYGQALSDHLPVVAEFGGGQAV
jgi:exonuclease III